MVNTEQLHILSQKSRFLVLYHNARCQQLEIVVYCSNLLFKAIVSLYLYCSSYYFISYICEEKKGQQ